MIVLVRQGAVISTMLVRHGLNASMAHNHAIKCTECESAPRQTNTSIIVLQYRPRRLIYVSFSVDTHT